MSLRLTLRTLLAYLEDTLEPEQAKAIGQKVAESDSARELIERIKQVTRRRRLTTPPTTGPGSKIDANTVAEYLDNVVTPEQAAEVEQICLSSDVHLAEVAACHQILTLIMGEPVNPDPEIVQRMYALAKGPGTLPLRKAARSKAKATAGYVEGRDLDETLRMGLPALRRRDGWRNPVFLIGGGVLAGILLVIAILHILSLPGSNENNRPDLVAQGDNGKEKNQGDTTKDKDDSKKWTEPKNTNDKKDATSAVTDKGKPKEETKEPNSGDTGHLTELAFAPPNPRQTPIGHYVPDPKASSILLQTFPEGKFDWKRLTAKQSEVYSARPLLSLPASRCVVQTNRGVRLTLWGNVPEFFPVPPVYESLVELYAHDMLDLDMRLDRGRVVLTSTRQDRPVRIRLRFENPMVPSDKDFALRQEFFDITLKDAGASMIVDRWSQYPRSEPFYKNPKNNNRIGPTASMGCIVVAGSVLFKAGDVTYTLTAPPGPAVVGWDSVEGPKGPFPSKELPGFVRENIPLPQGKDVITKRDYLSRQLASAGVDVALAQGLESTDPTTRRLVVRSLAAISDLPSLLEALGQPKYADLRLDAIDSLRNWIAASRDNDYKLLSLLREKYKHKEAEIIMEMMHSFSEAECRRPERYELLIDYLVNPNLVIRELGAWHLYQLVPLGKNIPYDAAADAALRERSEAQWRALIPAGQLPPTKAPQPKKKLG